MDFRSEPGDTRCVDIDSADVVRLYGLIEDASTCWARPGGTHGPCGIRQGIDVAIQTLPAVNMAWKPCVSVSGPEVNDMPSRYSMIITTYRKGYTLVFRRGKDI